MVGRGIGHTERSRPVRRNQTLEVRPAGRRGLTSRRTVTTTDGKTHTSLHSTGTPGVWKQVDTGRGEGEVGRGDSSAGSPGRSGEGRLPSGPDRCDRVTHKLTANWTSCRSHPTVTETRRKSGPGPYVIKESFTGDPSPDPPCDLRRDSVHTGGRRRSSDYTKRTNLVFSLDMTDFGW